MKQAVRMAMVMNFPRTYNDAVTRFCDGILNVLRSARDVEPLVVAPARFGARPGRPDLQLLVAVEQLLQLLTHRPTAVHVHEHPTALAAGVVYRGLTLGSARLVYTVHVQPVRARAYWKRAILGWLLARCTTVTSVSAETARRLGAIAAPPPRDVLIIPGAAEIRARPVDDPAIVQFRERFGLHAGPVLCQIGVNYPLKVAGLLRLLEALVLVRRAFPGARLLVVGDGPLRASVAEAVERLGLGDAVTLTGYVADISLPLSVADVYCHITLQDAAPLSVLEAMSCGKPIVAARTGGIPELVSDGIDGVLVEPEVPAIADAILDVLRSPARARSLAAAAQATAQLRFSWQRVANDFRPTYGVPSHGGA